MTSRAAYLVCCALLTGRVLGEDLSKLPPAEQSALTTARTRMLRGNYEEARTVYADLAKSAKSDMSRIAAAIGLAQLDRAQGEYDQAESTLTGAIQSLAGHSDLLAHRADLRYFRGRWEEARRDAEAALAKHPDHFLARWVIARIARDSGELTQAADAMRWFVRAYTQASDEDRDITDPDMLAIVGQAGTEHARWNRLPRQFSFILEEIYGDIIKTDRNYWMAEDLAGRLLLEKYNKAEAEEAFDNALKINPKAVEPHIGKGWLCIQTYELKEAETYAERALSLNPRHPEALRLRTELDLIAGDVKAAQRRLAVARQVNPRDEAVLGKLAACGILNRKPEAVEEMVREVERFDSKPAIFYLALGETLDERKLWAQAEGYLKKAVELRPHLPAPRVALAMLYLRLGREAEARPLLDEAAKADPFNVRVFNSRKVLSHLDQYTTIETPHYIVRFDPTQDRVLAEFIADYLEEVHGELKRQFQYEPPGKTLFELFSNHEMFSGRTIALPDLHTIGACTGKIVTMASPNAKELGRRFNWGRVIRHELVHVFNLAQSDFQVPHWLTEGLAVRNEGGSRLPQWLTILRERLADNQLLNLDTITLAFVRPKNHEEWSLAYSQSQLYVEYLIQTYGEMSVGKLLEGFRDGSDTTAVLQRILNTAKTTFESGYRRYVAEIIQQSTGLTPTRPEPAFSLAELEKAYRQNPSDREVAARLAEKYALAGKTREASQLVDGVLAEQPRHPRAVSVKARLLSREKKDDLARQLLEGALLESPDDPRLLLALGKLYNSAREWDKAARVFERGRKIAPLEANWLEILAPIYAETKQKTPLIDVLTDLAMQDPDNLSARFKLAELHHEASDFALAERWSREVLFIDVFHQQARSILLNALRQQGKDAEANRLSKRFQQ